MSTRGLKIEHLFSTHAGIALIKLKEIKEKEREKAFTDYTSP